MYPDKTHKEVLVIMGEHWKQLSDEEKRPYLEKAAGDRARYQQEMDDWRTRHPQPEKPDPTHRSKGYEDPIIII